MANTKAAIKDILKNRRNRARNIAYTSRMRTVIKQAIVAIESKNADAEKIVRSTLQLIDKTAAKGIISKKVAARKKSRLAKRFSVASSSPAPTKAAPKKEPAKKATASATKTTKKAAPKKEKAEAKTTK